MTRRFQGLGQTAAISEQEVPDGVYLVRVEKTQYRWHAQKPFYFLRLSVLEPRELGRPPDFRASLLHGESPVEAWLVPAGFHL